MWSWLCSLRRKVAQGNCRHPSLALHACFRCRPGRVLCLVSTIGLEREHGTEPAEVQMADPLLCHLLEVLLCVAWTRKTWKRAPVA